MDETGNRPAARPPQGQGRLDALARAAARHRLEIMGAFHPVLSDKVPSGTGTLVLLGPHGPDFWAHVSTQPEFTDGAADPLDRWSHRVIAALAAQLGGRALFPFTGPPWHPFYEWALRSGRAWPSPVRLLVHDRAGLWASFRGAVALTERLDLVEPPPANPCSDCAEKPCLSACPAGALGSAGYDIPACHAWLDTPAGGTCLNAGCLVRRACPVSARYERPAQQSAYHMQQFHPA